MGDGPLRVLRVGEDRAQADAVRVLTERVLIDDIDCLHTDLATLRSRGAAAGLAAWLDTVSSDIVPRVGRA